MCLCVCVCVHANVSEWWLTLRQGTAICSLRDSKKKKNTVLPSGLSRLGMHVSKCVVGVCVYTFVCTCSRVSIGVVCICTCMHLGGLANKYTCVRVCVWVRVLFELKAR